MTRHYGLTQRERLHLNLLQAADYKSLRYEGRHTAFWLFVWGMCFAFCAAWVLL